jgi:hypothetical protein
VLAQHQERQDARECTLKIHATIVRPGFHVEPGVRARMFDAIRKLHTISSTSARARRARHAIAASERADVVVEVVERRREVLRLSVRPSVTISTAMLRGSTGPAGRRRPSRCR